MISTSSNKNVNIRFNIVGTTSFWNTLIIERLESEMILKKNWSNKAKEPKQDSQNRLGEPVPERGEP
jgi:hypothetical protein